MNLLYIENYLVMYGIGIAGLPSMDSVLGFGPTKQDERPNCGTDQNLGLDEWQNTNS